MKEEGDRKGKGRGEETGVGKKGIETGRDKGIGRIRRKE